LSIVVNREQVQDIEPLSELQCHRAVVTSLTSCQLDGRNTLITTSEDGTVALHSVDQKVGVLKGHRATVTSAAFLSWNDQPMILTGSLDSTVQLWEFRGWFKGWTSVLTIMYDSPVLSAAHDLVNGVELVYASCANGEVNVCELVMSDSGSLISRSGSALSATVGEGEKYQIVGEMANVRKSARIGTLARIGLPGERLNIVGELPRGTTVMVLERRFVDGNKRARIGDDRWISIQMGTEPPLAARDDPTSTLLPAPLRGQPEGEAYVVMKRPLDVSTSFEGGHIIGSLRQGTAFNAVASQAQRTSNDINTDTMTDRNVCFQFVSNPGPPAVIICT
jgi:hypothetical protein